MTIGVDHLRDEKQVERLHWMLALPFVGGVGNYPINERSSGENPMDRLAGQYGQWFDSPAGRSILEIERKCVHDVLGDGAGRWLEVGVGTGRFAAALGIREGVDPADAALALARRRGIDTRQGVAERLPHDDATFDGILLVVAICFLRDLPSALHEFRRVLRPHGRLVIGMIPRESPWGLTYAERGRRGHPFYSIARFFSPQEVTSLAEQEGFVFDRASSTLFRPPEEPPAPDRRSGIVAEAGFVCLGFTMKQRRPS